MMVIRYGKGPNAGIKSQVVKMGHGHGRHEVIDYEDYDYDSLEKRMEEYRMPAGAGNRHRRFRSKPTKPKDDKKRKREKNNKKGRKREVKKKVTKFGPDF